MSPFMLKKGTKFLYKGQTYLMITFQDLSNVLAKNIETQEIHKIPIFEIELLEEEKENKPDIDTEIIPDKYWEVARERFKIIEPLLKPDRTRKEVIEIAKKHNIHYSTIYRWIRDYEESGGLLSSLIPNYSSRGGKNKKRTDKEVEEIMDYYIKNVYMSNERKISIKRAYSEFLVACNQIGLKPVHYNTFLNRIREIHPYEIIKKREGKVKAESLYGASEKPFEANYPLEIIQIDHTPLDIQVVDEIYREPIGRPYITVAIDIYSRMIYGFYISLERPSLFSVGQAILQGALRKEEYLQEIGVEGKWEVWGLPKNLTIHTDNAGEFRSKDFTRFCEEFGINLAYRPKKTPKYGGHIERFLRTLNSEIHNLPGSTFSNPQKRGEYKSEEKAVFTLSELEKWIAHWIVNIYHKRVHSEIKTTPEKKFRDGILGTDKQVGIGLPPLITGHEAERLKIALLPSFQRTIQKDGIHFKGIRYYDNILKPFIRYGEKANQEKQKYTFKYDPRDMRFLYFLHPEHKTYHKISCRDKRFPKISLWELNKVHQYLKEKNLKEYDEEQIIRAIKQLFQIEKQSIEKSKETKRRISSKKYHQGKQKLEEKYINTSNNSDNSDNKDDFENLKKEGKQKENQNQTSKKSIFDIKDDEAFEIE